MLKLLFFLPFHKFEVGRQESVASSSKEKGSSSDSSVLYLEKIDRFVKETSINDVTYIVIQLTNGTISSTLL